ncbi:hypothetical protein Pmar_PMAR006767 [Perkinsus marinus ATCC 50983]|uniref:Uncharacterized protein n=1 Tax=Perkinsus marinus (strain ATCC 50983 / TXsc) TaxID=423536 RepID=C5K6F5_PERM5|nr:hypothetical protein Pmar_PMAR006767 [Perkinsus marinus ATCC 50983]EER19875.1 hypothetical protein Pmar_PMAR006767 [Perkinsus marinus ATCC 50983]|eukprot:XP_002788079.1 hypothetical protein Pmar_PMAR006767 [Perkinsus marinus ATCC 50983]
MSMESIAAKVQATSWADPPAVTVAKCMLEQVDSSIEGMDGHKLAANIRETALGIFVKALVRDVKINKRVGNKVIDDLREELLVPGVDFNKIVQTYDFTCPLSRLGDVTYSRDLVVGVGPRDTWFGKVKGPQVYNSQGLVLSTLPVIDWELFNEFESRIMDLPLLNTFHIVPEVWYKMEPRLRLFICNNITRFDGISDVVDVKCLHLEGIDYPPRLANLGQFIRFMVVRTFLDLTNQWDSESTYPVLVLSRMAYDSKAVVQKVKPVTLSLFFTIKRVYAMYNTIFWRTLWAEYTHCNEYHIVQQLERKFDQHSFQVFKRYEPYLQYFLVDGAMTEGILEAIPHIEKAYCYPKSSYSSAEDGERSWNKDDGTWKSPNAYGGKKNDGSESKVTWSKTISPEGSNREQLDESSFKGANETQGSSSKVSDVHKVDGESRGYYQQEDNKVEVDVNGVYLYGIRIAMDEIFETPNFSIY